MPGMGMSSGGGTSALALAEIALFWTAAIVHLLRLLSPTQLPDRDRPADAGHAVMGAGMTLMVFPGVSAGTLHMAAACYAVLAVAYLARAALPHRSPTRHRCQNTAIGASQAAMAYMLAAPTHPPSWVSLGVAGVLAACAVVHGRRLIDAQHWHQYQHRQQNQHQPGDPVSAASAPRMLVVVPHVGALVMTMAMAAMVVIV